MELLGDRNWWIPKWLDRVLPRLDVEGKHYGAADTAPADAADLDDDPQPVTTGH
jgi:RND superfamily putative drug exporter